MKFTYQYGGKHGTRHRLQIDPQFLAVRTRNRKPVLSRAAAATELSESARQSLDDFQLVARFPEAGVEVLRARRLSGSRVRRDRARRELKKDPQIRFAGRVLATDAGEPVLYTENFFVQFEAGTPQKRIRALLKKYRLQLKRSLPYALRAFFVSAPEGTGLKTFSIAQKLLREKSVALCHPELIRESRRRNLEAVERGSTLERPPGVLDNRRHRRSRRPPSTVYRSLITNPGPHATFSPTSDFGPPTSGFRPPSRSSPSTSSPPFPQQWHLGPTTLDGMKIDAHAGVVEAWKITRGEGIVIALIDDGFDLDHEEFQSKQNHGAVRRDPKKQKSASRQ